ncbi:MAG: PilN domain-containing protein [Pseudolabrys sp.]
MFSSIKQAIAWFIDGLLEVVAVVDDRIRHRVPLRLVRADDGYAIEQPDGIREPQHIRLDRSGDMPKFAPAPAAAVLKDRDVDLLLPASELLVRTLDPLPADSRPYLDGIVRHQLERLVPWRSDDVLFGYQVAPAGPKDDRIVVTISATARSLHAPMIAALRDVGPRNLRLLYPNVPPAGTDVAIRADNNGGDVARLAQLRFGIIAAVAALVILGVVGIGYLTYSWQQSSTTLASADDEIADLRKKLAARGPQQTGSERDLAAIIARKRATPVTVVAIDAIANALPDDTWLTELNFADGHVKMSGVSRNVAELVPLIEKVPGFAEATFFAPTSRLQDNQGDRFHLDARIVPAKVSGK